MANRLRAWVGWVPPSGGGAGGWVSGWSSAALATTLAEKQSGISRGHFSFTNTNASHAREALELVAENRCAQIYADIVEDFEMGDFEE
jgi:anti-sigma factor RsiW